MTVTATLRLEYASPDEAERIARTLAPDNQGYIQVTVSGNVILATATASTAGSLRHTLDDFLACLSLAERTGEVLK
ncbi:MAG TPA: hypothetical protein ENN54_02570 [Thermoplasmatales archaeon]|nr:hypothetical protein [Thermoplasmatales archaeon]